MRILPINNYKLQISTKISFKGSQDTSLSQQLEDAVSNLELKGKNAEADEVYKRIIDETALRILGKSHTPEDEDVLIKAGSALVRNAFCSAIDKKNTCLINDALKTAEKVSRILDNIGKINPIPAMVRRLSVVLSTIKS